MSFTNYEYIIFKEKGNGVAFCIKYGISVKKDAKIRSFGMKKYSILLIGSVYSIVFWGASPDFVSGLNPDSYDLFMQNETKKEVMGRLADVFAQMVQVEIGQFSGGFIQYFASIDRNSSAGQAHAVLEQYTQDHVNRLRQELQALQINIVQEYYKQVSDQGYAINWDVKDQQIINFMNYSTAILNQGYQTILDLVSRLYTARMSELVNINLQQITSEVEKVAFKEAQEYLKARHIKPETPQEEIQRVAQGLLIKTLKKLEDEIKDELRKKAQGVFHSLETNIKDRIDSSVKGAQKAAVDAATKALVDGLTGAHSDDDVDEKEDALEPVTA